MQKTEFDIEEEQKEKKDERKIATDQGTGNQRNP